MAPKANSAFQGSGSGRSKFQSLNASGADAQGKGFRRGKGFKKKRMLNGNYIKGGGGTGSSVDISASLEREKRQDDLDAQCGFVNYNEGPAKLGWLVNYNTCAIEDKDTGQLCSAVACYFMCQNGDMFKCKLQYAPYFYLQVKDDREMEVEAFLRRKFEGLIKTISIVYREDLDLKNHLAGHQRKLMQVAFDHTQALMDVRSELMPVVQKNKANAKRSDAYSLLTSMSSNPSGAATVADAMDAVEDIREYDVPFHVRYAIDAGLRSGHWYSAAAHEGSVALMPRPDLIFRGEPRVCAFDIETTKLPLHFPNAEHDQVFMISYMVDKQGYLIVNREVVGDDIDGFEYTPKPEFQGPFEIFNEADERATLQRWFTHMNQVRPGIYVTYNGDNFDWPFIETRARHHGLSVYDSLGFRAAHSGEFVSKNAVHMDCLCWVNRDSYLPQGSRGLKAVTKAKLGYDPVEVDPEDMVPLAQTRPQAMASYSVSDAVATYYLYMTYIHPFIFSLATIIPLPPDDVLRKGSGTLCEHLLMVEAYRSNVVCPNKHTDASERFYKGRLLSTETYIGGKVEAIESGIFRADIPCAFSLQPAAYQELIDRLDKDLRYGLEVECKADLGDLENYDEVKQEIVDQLAALRDEPQRNETPCIYHLDVAAMYPNIILTNRLQPSAIVTDADCAACDFNHPGKRCLRPLEWVWRGETYMVSQSEYAMLRAQLELERFPAEEEGAPPVLGRDLKADKRAELLEARIKRYAQRVYKRVSAKPETAVRTAGVCQRENSFYVDTVLAFRDRRYEYKDLVKKWKRKLGEAQEQGDKAAVVEAQDMGVLYDSLQLAHKCILNSFYGYVMRKGARWYSMEMAGVTTYTGAQIIKRACDLVERIGRPLELDTDGIWCCLPGSFPEEFAFKTAAGKTHKVNYPGLMLNVMCAEHNANPQYHSLEKGPDGTVGYEVSSRMSIEFEVDGPYLAMVLPASKEEGKLIKKRYAVFNFDGSLAELKGFEIKRRGELKLIKAFQAEVFDHFLQGTGLDGCYDAVASVADRWLDLLDTRGMDLKDAELIEYLSESCVMSKSVDDYGERKSSAITTARRLAAFLGDDRLKDKGLVCNYLIAQKPLDAPTSERAIPVIIFSAEAAVARAFLRRWTGDSPAGDATTVPDVREFIDWAYYRERISSAIQKIITIPAAYQSIANPVPRVPHPDWLLKRLSAASDARKQRRISSMFAVRAPKRVGSGSGGGEVDMEDVGTLKQAAPAARAQTKKRRMLKNLVDSDDEDAEGAAGDEAAADESAQAGDDTDALEDDMDLEDPDAADDDDDDVDVENVPDNQGDTPGNAATATKKAGGPTMRRDYRGWIKARKPAWRARRAALKAQGRVPGDGAPAALAGLGGGVQKQVEAIMHATWHIIQVEPGSVPGQLDVWALIDTAMHKMVVEVPRKVYVDIAAESAALLAGARRVDRTLPDGSKPAHLLELELPEEELLNEAQTIAHTLAAPQIRGCYESRVPAALSALAQLSCAARVTDRHLPAPPRVWSLSHLSRHQAAVKSYLSGSRSDADGDTLLGLVRVIVLVEMVPERSVTGRAPGRGVWALLLPQSKKVVVVVAMKDVVAPRELFSSVAEDMWDEVVAEAATMVEQPPLGDTSEYRVEVAYVRDEAEARARLASDVAALRAGTRGPMLAIVEAAAAAAAARLRRSVPALRAMPCYAAAAPAPAAMFAAGADWQQDAPRAALLRAALAPAWLAARAPLARYTGVPLCNLGRSAHATAMDIAFARALRDSSHLLWAEDPALPDVVPAQQRADEADIPGPDPISINNQGAHRCVCVELQPQFLLLCAVLQSAELAEAEGALASHSQAGRTLAVLRSMLAPWADDASIRNIGAADELLRRLHSWLLDPTSALHSPLLLSTVDTAVAKTFLQLLAELRALDATVVAASPASIIIATRKHTPAAAAAYVRFLTDTIARRPLFAWLALPPARVWLTLLWRDAFNYAGLRVPLTDLDAGGPAAGTATAAAAAAAAAPAHLAAAAEPPQPPRDDGADLEDDMEGEEQEERDGEGPDGAGDSAAPRGSAAAPPQLPDAPGFAYEAHWNLREFLPAAVHKYFDDVVERFVTRPWRSVHTDADAAQGGGTQALADTRTADARTLAYLQEWLPSRLLERLFQMAQAIARHILPGAAAAAARFPQRPGSHIPAEQLGTPALAFVRTVCAVLALDATVPDEVSSMKRQLLALLHVREFAFEAEFRDPCKPLVLPAVPCSHCFTVAPLDVTRGHSGGAWRCGACGEPRAAADIEARLLSRLRCAVTAGTLCDLRCRKCKALSRGGAERQCTDCGGELVFARDGGVLRLEACVIASIARYHEMTELLEAAEWIASD
eukprot:jgi/Ulvmu1/3914/UM018_0137.1